jgi:hypothetical protein
MVKTKDERFAGVVDAVRKRAGDNAATLVEKSIENLGTNRDPIGSALSLGSRSDNSTAETDRRNAMRAVLFLLFTEGKQPTVLAPSFIAKYSTWSLAQLGNELESRLPLLSDDPVRAAWSPSNFSSVTNPPPARFRYIVFGMMNAYTGRGVSYDTILDDPNIIRSFALSTSLIGEGHIATYYPYGLILKVPAENIVSTHHKDQAFKNYKAQDPNNVMSPAQLNDLRDEIRRVSATYGLKSPDDVLKDVKPDSDFGYSEVVVLGTSPGGYAISVQGFFMKVDSKGGRYVRPDMALMGRKNESAFVTDAIYTKMSKSGLPIVELVDRSGKNK